MTTNPWHEDDLQTVVRDLWPGTIAQLATKLRVTRKVVFRLLAGTHASEPVGMIESLHRELQPQLKKLGHRMAVGDLREAWRRSRAAVTLRADR